MPYAARGITKSFAGVTVLRDVDFNITEGQIQGLIGENGAGKSTLLKVMAGLHAPSAGSLLWDGDEVTLNSIQDASKRGVYLVPQEPSLLPYLSIAENLSLGQLPSGRGPLPRVDWKTMERHARESLERLGFSVDVRLLAGGLSIAAQQLVECARALAFDCRYILFDEPTSPLDAAEVDMLAGRLGDLRDKGHGIVLISHRLSEMFDLSDTITVLRDGKVVGEPMERPYSRESLVQAMIGRELTEDGALARPTTAGTSLALQVTGIVSPPEVHDVSFDVKVGEIVGLAGLIGSGRTETAECVVGLRRKDAGQVTHRDKPLSKSTADAYRDGVVYVSEDRAKNGSFLELSVASNLTAGILDRLSGRRRMWIMSRQGERAAAVKGAARTDVRAASTEMHLKSLSGGNQQKCLIARALLTEPDVLILDEPTRGVDIGAKRAIHDIIRGLADDGLGVVVISSELEELTAVADRIVVLYEGRTVQSFSRKDDGGWDHVEIGRAVVGDLALTT